MRVAFVLWAAQLDQVRARSTLSFSNSNLIIVEYAYSFFYFFFSARQCIQCLLQRASILQTQCKKYINHCRLGTYSGTVGETAYYVTLDRSGDYFLGNGI